jgi:hypothetical protein
MLGDAATGLAELKHDSTERRASASGLLPTVATSTGHEQVLPSDNRQDVTATTVGGSGEAGDRSMRLEADIALGVSLLQVETPPPYRSSGCCGGTREGGGWMGHQGSAFEVRDSGLGGVEASAATDVGVREQLAASEGALASRLTALGQHSGKAHPRPACGAATRNLSTELSAQVAKRITIEVKEGRVVSEGVGEHAEYDIVTIIPASAGALARRALVSRRFSEFRALQAQLQGRGGFAPRLLATEQRDDLPASWQTLKKAAAVFGTARQSVDVMHARRPLLQRCLHDLCRATPSLLLRPQTLSFLGLKKGDLPQEFVAWAAGGGGRGSEEERVGRHTLLQTAAAVFCHHDGVYRAWYCRA